jgi:hypothetical protein
MVRPDYAQLTGVSVTATGIKGCGWQATERGLGMERTKGLRVIACLIAITGICVSIAYAGGSTSFETLDPGKTLIVKQEIPINIVFVGYEKGTGDQDINQADFVKGLPTNYRPVARADWYYGRTKPMPMEYTYKYNLVYADTEFEDAFFGYLEDIGTETDITFFQELYNDQNAASETITDNLTIDAPKTEHWLAKNAPLALGVDTKQYTVFLINWSSRSDFRPHVYSKIGEPDPDTDFDFGKLDSRKIIAWGGTAPDDEETGSGNLARIWFYDLSAGPEAWTGNYDLDNADLTGDGVLDYRMPPVWEYGNTTGYRKFDDLSGDLAKVTRYVAIQMLFTPSPIYDPAISAPKLPGSINLDLNVYNYDDAGSDANDFLDLPYLLDEVQELQPYIKFTIDSEDVKFTKRALDVYNCASTFVFPPEFWESCYGKRIGFPLADLYLYHSDKILDFLEGDDDYELPTFIYNLSDTQIVPFLGLADDNWTEPTQSFLYCLGAPFIRDIGYGFTATTIHEAGHHLGVPHPHDGHDWETDSEYYVDGAFLFAASGDEVNSMMSYIDLNWDFSQFDRDNMDRWMTATYINMANAVLVPVCKSPRANKVSEMLASADDDATDALKAYGDSKWYAAVVKAKSCYDTVMAAAAKINVKIEPQARPADVKARGTSRHLINPINYLRGQKKK